MEQPRQHSLMPCFNIVGYHITQRPGNFASWDLRIDARDRDAITIDDIGITEAQAFIKCFQRMLIHTAQHQGCGHDLPSDQILADEDQDGRSEPPPLADGPPSDPSGTPRTDPPSTGPKPEAAQEPYVTGGWVPAGTATQLAAAMVTAGEYVLPGLPPTGTCHNGEWIAPAAGTAPQNLAHGRQYELDNPLVISLAGSTTTHVPPRIVHVAPGKALLIECTCWLAAGGALADNPNCQMHHGTPTTYVFNVH